MQCNGKKHHYNIDWSLDTSFEVWKDCFAMFLDTKQFTEWIWQEYAVVIALHYNLSFCIFLNSVGYQHQTVKDQHMTQQVSSWAGWGALFKRLQKHFPLVYPRVNGTHKENQVCYHNTSLHQLKSERMVTWKSDSTGPV